MEFIMRKIPYEFELTEIRNTAESLVPSEAKSAQALATLAVAERLTMVLAALDNIHHDLMQIATKKG
jgi:hypothetical protein